MNPLLEVKDVCLSYHSLSGETAALSHISFHLMPEEFLAVVGPSGCGKSTLLNLICGLLHAESGTILMNGKPLNKDSARIGYMLQKDHLLEWRSIYRNVLLGLEIQGELTKDNLSYVDELLKLYELDKFRNSRPSQLSGGMRQRAALIRTLVLKPDLLLLDEPFSALDYQTRLNVSDDIGKILKKQRKPAILVTHDISDSELTQRVISHVEAEAKIDDAEVHFLTVIPSLPYYASLGLAYSAELPAMDDLKAEAKSQLEEIIKKFKLPTDRVHVHVEEGSPKDRILELAKKIPAHMIIIASHRPDITTYLLGSNAAAVVRHAECSVLVVR